MLQNRWVLSLVGGLSILVAPGSEAQQAPGTLEALLGEVRLLRQALEKQASLQARAQLMAGRLALQDQRLERARSEVRRSEAETQALSGERTRMQGALVELRRSLETADAAEQVGLEREQRMLSMRLGEIEKTLDAAETRRNQATQAIAAEEARYEELARWFDDFDRELARLAH
jgi:DNA repair exonuclease SbcCD ATPase subunit